jgi:hypothetical protein
MCTISAQVVNSDKAEECCVSEIFWRRKTNIMRWRTQKSQSRGNSVKKTEYMIQLKPGDRDIRTYTIMFPFEVSTETQQGLRRHKLCNIRPTFSWIFWGGGVGEVVSRHSFFWNAALPFGVTGARCLETARWSRFQGLNLYFYPWRWEHCTTSEHRAPSDAAAHYRRMKSSIAPPRKPKNIDKR